MSQQTQSPSTFSANSMEASMIIDETPRIYVASLSDYNNGILHGCWIDATIGYDCIFEQINAMLAASPAQKKYGDKAEEFAIHDHEYFQSVEINEYSCIEWVANMAEALEEHGEAFAAFVKNGGYRYTEVSGIIAEFQEAYCGTYESELAYATEIAEESFPPDAPQFLLDYFDYELYARDLFLDGYFSCEISDGYAIFQS